LPVARLFVYLVRLQLPLLKADCFLSAFNMLYNRCQCTRKAASGNRFELATAFNWQQATGIWQLLLTGN
jgi:hypothetical protein